MFQHKVSKITISLPQMLLELANRLAELLRKEENAQTQLLTAEGYRQLSDENRWESEEALNLTNDVILRDD